MPVRRNCGEEMKTRRLSYPIQLFLVAVILVIPAGAFGRPEMSSSILSPAREKTPNGEFVAQVWSEEGWKEAGRIPFDKYFRENKIDIQQSIATSPLRIRITEKGGGAAHIDAVLLGGTPPREAREAAQGVWKQVNLKKVAQKDYDVIDAFQKTFEFTFPAAGDKTLSLTARIESPVISKTPFQFPIRNLYRPMSKDSQFYRYKWNSQKGTLNLDGKMNELSGEKPFFREFSHAGSGHPSGFTYGWVRNDEKNLYAALDFTSDDTYDGEKDYATVYVKTDRGLKEFKVSVPETRWGKPFFTYTDKVKYEHKVYEFKIPLSELGIEGNEDARPLELAFAAYGTSTPGDWLPAIAYDSLNNRLLVVFTKVVLSGGNYYAYVYGQILNGDGTPYGPEFPISGTLSGQNPVTTSVAFDSSSQRYLVVWPSMNIYGQLVNADGTPEGSAIQISNTAYDVDPAVATDTVNHRFLVVWTAQGEGMGDIHGQIFNNNGTPFIPFPFAVCNASLSIQWYPALAFDDVNGNFLVVWEDLRNPTHDIYGQFVRASDGVRLYTASNINFAVSNAAGRQAYPSVAYAPANQRFLVVWDDDRNSSSDIFGQLVDASGSLYNTDSDINFVISNNFGHKYQPSVTYDSMNHRFLTTWYDYRNETTDIYGQLLNSSGTLYNTASDVNFAVALSLNFDSYPAVVFNSQTGSFVTAYSATYGGVFLSVTEYPVRRFLGSVTGNYMTISEAYFSAAEGEVIEAQAGEYSETLYFYKPASLTFRGGFEAGFETNPGYSTVLGSLTVRDGTITAERLILK